MFKTRLKAGSLVMSWQPQSKKVRRLVDMRAIRPSDALRYVERSNIKLSVVKLSPRRYDSLSDYIEDMDSYVTTAADAGSQLVAFPELTGMLPISLMPGFSAFLSDLADLEDSPENLHEAFSFIIESVAGFVSDIYLNTFGALSAAHRIMIAPGSFYVMENSGIYNRALLFSETGTVLGAQDKLILSPFERTAGVKTGERLDAFQTKLGRIAMISAAAAGCYQPYYIAKAQKAEIILTPSSPFGDRVELSRYRANEAGVTLLSAGISGSGDLGLKLSNSPAAIYAPMVATKGLDGVIALTQKEAVLTSRIDLSKGSDFFDIYSSDKNPGFFKALIS